MFGLEMWAIWVIAGIVLVVIEIFTPGFFFMSVGVAAILTGLLATFVDSLIINLIFFIISFSVLFLSLKKIGNKLLGSNLEETNVLGLIGKPGKVTQAIHSNEKGYVKVGGEEWSAISDHNQELNVGQLITVKNVDGNKLVVSEQSKVED